MKKVISFLCIIFVISVSVNAQDSPEWVDPDIREFLYPKEKYIVGYAEQIVNNKKLIPYITEQTKTLAQTNLMEGIYIKIKSSTSSQIESTSVNGSYMENESFSSNSTKSLLADVNGMQVQTFYNSKTKYSSNGDLFQLL